MFRIQNLVFKIIPIFITLTAFTVSAKAQGTIKELDRADSLFALKKYTQSFGIYDSLLTRQGLVSPAMLLKMAYIREGLGDYPNALYYLNMYYLRTNNKRALRKMEDIAKKYDLKGYRYTDLEFFMNIFYRYYTLIVFSLCSMLLLLVAYMVYKKRRLHEQPGLSLFFMSLTLAVLFYVVNFGKSYHKGIIIRPDTYLMAGPSAGSELVAIAGQGHRLKVKGKKDVWIRVEWDDHDAYVRENNLLQVMEM